MIPTIIRTHVKTEERLKLLRLTCESWKNKKLHRAGDLFIADDQSPMQEEVQAITNKFKGTYVRSSGTPSTCNGLANALRAQNNFPALLCVDDIVFGGETKDKVLKIVEREIPLLGDNFGMVQLFVPASVAHNFRTPQTLVPDTKLHLLYNESNHGWLFHAAVMNIWSQKLATAYLEQYEALQTEFTARGETVHDDHAARLIAQRNELDIYCTTTCWAWHTGGTARSFIDPNAGGSNYQAHKFSGSNEDKCGY